MISNKSLLIRWHQGTNNEAIQVSISMYQWDAHNDNDLYVCMRTAFIFLFLYVYMVLHHLAFMYYALILLCQEWRNKDVQSINIFRLLPHITLHMTLYGTTAGFDTTCMYSVLPCGAWPIWSEPCLTHWGRVTHICVGNLTIIGSDNGLSPGRRQAISPGAKPLSKQMLEYCQMDP